MPVCASPTRGYPLRVSWRIWSKEYCTFLSDDFAKPTRKSASAITKGLTNQGLMGPGYTWYGTNHTHFACLCVPDKRIPSARQPPNLVQRILHFFECWLCKTDSKIGKRNNKTTYESRTYGSRLHPIRSQPHSFCWPLRRIPSARQQPLTFRRMSHFSEGLSLQTGVKNRHTG